MRLSIRLFLSLLATTLVVQAANAMTPEAFYQYRIGDNAYRAGKTQIALDHYYKAQQQDPTDSTIYLTIGQLLEKNGQADDALNVYKQGISYNPKDIMLNAVAGRIVEQQLGMEAAKEYYGKLVNTKFDFPYVFYFKGSATDVEAANIIDITPFYSKDANGNIVFKSYFPHKYYGYETFTDKPQFADVYEVLGNIYTRLGYLNDAKSAYTTAINVDPQGKFRVYKKLANLAKLQGRPSDLARANNNYQAYVNLGRTGGDQTVNTVSSKIVQEQSKPVIVASGTVPNVVTTTTTTSRSISSLPDAGQVYLALPRTSTTTSVEQAAEPLGYDVKYNPSTYDVVLQKLITEPNNIDSLLTLASMDIDRYKFTDALYYLNIAANANPNNYETYWLMSEAYQGLAQYDMAQATYEKALGLRPNNIYLQNEYVAVLRKTGQWDNADNYISSTKYLYQAPELRTNARIIEEVPAQAYPLLVPNNAGINRSSSTSSMYLMQSGSNGGFNSGNPNGGGLIIRQPLVVRDLAPRSFGNHSNVYVLP